MSATNAKIAQKLEAFIVTMERLCDDMRSVSTSSFENTMNATKIQLVKDKLSDVEANLSTLHTRMADACATSSDNDVLYRGGGGNGK